MSDLAIGLRAELRDGRLVLRYSVRNDLGRDVYLENRLYTSSPRLLSPDIAYVELDVPDRLVRVYKGTPSQPPGRMSGPPVLISPYVTPVRAGTVYSETIRIPAPVRIFRAYGASPPVLMPPEERINAFRGVSLDLAWYAREPGVIETAGVRFDQPVILPSGYKTIPALHVVRSPVVELSVPVILPPS